MSAGPDRNLALELVRVTEAAALGAARWIGRGDKNAADQAAVDAMRLMLDTVAMDGVVVIGEGEKDEAPMLYNGEHVGNGAGPEVDVAVDPLEGTRLTALGQPNAIAVIAVGERGSMLFPGAAVYMDKIAVGAEAADAIDIEASAAENVRRVAEAKGMEVGDVTVVVLERERHDALIAELREAGARVNLIRDGDVAPCDRRGAAVHGRRHADGDRRHARGRHLGGRDQVSRRRDPGQAVAAGRRGAAEARRCGLRRRQGVDDGRPRRRRQRLRRRDRRHERRAAARRARERGRASRPSRS